MSRYPRVEERAIEPLQVDQQLLAEYLQMKYEGTKPSHAQMRSIQELFADIDATTYEALF